MNSKLSLILLGALVTLAVLSAAENPEESSLSKEVASSRLARAADADPGKSKKKSKSKNKKASKKSKYSRKNKKASKKGNSKRKNQKASKKNKSKRKNKKAIKKNKSKRKNKKGSRQDKSKNKKASKKSKRKSKKESKKDKSKRKNNKRNQKKAGKRTIKVRQGASTVPDTCISTATNALYNGFSKKATNFERQLKRIETRLPKIGSKRGKASEYSETLDDLVAANTSCPAGNVTELDALVATWRM